MKIFTFKNLSKLLEITFQAWIFITLLSPSSETSSTFSTTDVSIADRIDNLKKLKEWMDDGNDPKGFQFDD